MHIIGTAGHVDHGKSSLVAALTGTDPDRWIEEQLRGMTLDLGFAHLRIGELEAGIVDVPGHERFLHNMLAGAAGMEVLLLVVAANEGVMPQTREHLQILRYLNVQRTILVVTKSDLLDPAQLDAALMQIAEQLAGTLADGAPAVAVSSSTGAGLEDLRELIGRVLSDLPDRPADAPLYMPVDRVFAPAGHGTVVTGTLMQGSVSVGDTVALQPSGLRARVRSLQVFGRSQTTAYGGARVALNVPGIERSRIARGEVVASLETGVQDRFAVSFEPLPDALSLLRRRMPVRASIGSAEVLGMLLFEEAPRDAHAVAATLALRVPAVAFPGVRFVLRRLSPKTLLGGGVIAGAQSAAPEPGDDYDASQAAVLAVLRAAPLEPSDLAAIAFAANLREDAARSALAQVCERGEALRIARPVAYIDAVAASQMLEGTLAVLEQAHAEAPWSQGLTSLALARRLQVAEPLLVRVLAAYVDDGRLALRAGYYASPSHVTRLTAEQSAFLAELVPSDPQQPFLPANAADAYAAVRASSVAGVSAAFDTLLARDAFVKVGDALYRGSQINRIVERVDAYLRAQGQMTASQFRDLLGTSRKYAVPLLEWLDARGVTVRSGDLRVLRKR
ncbi:MAG: selenocysteine-specific translation elongation factor [Vulcanimicrobiaceae bacterium]